MMELTTIFNLEKEKEALKLAHKEQIRELELRILNAEKTLSDKDLIRFRTQKLIESSNKYGSYGSEVNPTLINGDFCNELAFYILDNFPSKVMLGPSLICKDGVLSPLSEEAVNSYLKVDLRRATEMIDAFIYSHEMKDYNEKFGEVRYKEKLFRFSVTNKSKPDFTDIKESVDRWASKFEQIFIHDITWMYRKDGPIISGLALYKKTII